MKKLSDKKIDKLIKNHLDGMLIGPNARQLKIARNTAKRHLREHGLLGPPHQAQNTYLTSSCQQNQRAFVGQLSRSNQPYSTPGYYDTSITDPTELKYLRDENKKLEKARDDLTKSYEDVINKFGDLVEENTEKNKELEQSTLNSIKLITTSQQLMEKQKELHKSELEKQKTSFDQEMKTMKQQHQCELDGQKTRHDREMGIMKQQYEDKLTSQQKRYEELTDKFNSVNNEYEDLTDKYGELKGENQRLQEKQDNKGIELGIAVLCGVGGGLLLHPKALEWIKNFLAPRLAPYGININDLASLIKYGMNSYKPTPAAHD